jgi:selenophosphate synthetase-related protein
MNPTLTGYTGAMVVHWVPDVTVTGGGTTLNVDMLGARDVKLADGTSDPAATDIVGGRMYQMWYDAGLGKFRLQQGVDAAVALTRTGNQAGQTLLCASSGGSGAAYTCTMNPTLTGYTGAMVVHWVPGVTVAGGGTTLNVDMLGARDVKLADGTSDPAPTDVIGGRMYQMWYDAGLGKFRLQQGVDAAVALTRTGSQAGQALICGSSGGSGAAYTCTMNPTLTGYSGGMVVHWVPDVTSTGGGTTLNVDMLGAKDVKLADGTSDPTPTDIVGGRMYQMWYDAGLGKFRLQQGVDAAVALTRTGNQAGQTLLCASSGGSGAAYTCAMNPTLTGYSGGMVVHWVPDVTVADGGTNLNMDMLGAKDVKLADGTSDPSPTDIVGGRMYQIWYDAAIGKFRRVQ